MKNKKQAETACAEHINTYDSGQSPKEQSSVANTSLSESHQTEMGPLPKDWVAVQLRQLFKLKNGFAFKGEFFSNSGPVVLTPGNFKLEGGLYFERRNTKHYSASYPKSYELEYDDLVVVMTDLTPDCNLLGKPAFIDTRERLLHNQRIGKIEQLSGRWDKKYLFYSLLSKSYLSTVKNAATGSTVRHTSPSTIYSAWVAEPPKKEQTAIANALSDVDALINSLEKLIAKKQAIKTATMQQLLTGKTRLPQFATHPDGTLKGYKQTELGEIPEDWDANNIGHFNPYITSGSRGWAEYYAETGNPFIRITNLNRGTIYLDTSDLKYVSLPENSAEGIRTQLNCGDVLVSITADIGIIGYFDEILDKPAYINQHIALMRFNEDRVDTKFLSYFLITENVQKIFRGGTDQGAKAGMNLDGVRSILFAVPPKAEQTAISTILSDIDREIKKLQKRLSKTRQIKQGMMQELLTGKTRLLKPVSEQVNAL